MLSRFKVQISNIPGEIVRKTSVDPNSSVYESNVSDLLSGVYFLKLIGENGWSGFTKLVKI